MWAEAIFLKADLEEVTGELFPLRIVLGEGGSGGTVLLTDRRDLGLVPGVGPLRRRSSREPLGVRGERGRWLE